MNRQKRNARAKRKVAENRRRRADDLIYVRFRTAEERAAVLAEKAEAGDGDAAV